MGQEYKAWKKWILIGLVVVSSIGEGLTREGEVAPQEQVSRRTDYPMYRLIVRFKDNAIPFIPSQSHQEKIEHLNRVALLEADWLGMSELGWLKSIGKKEAVIMTDRLITRAQMEILADSLRRSPTIDAVALDELIFPTYTPSDTAFSSQWYMGNGIHVGDANIQDDFDRMVTFSQTNVQSNRVAVIDTGSTNHNDFAANLIPGYDFVTDAGAARDGDGVDPNPNDEGDWGANGACNGQSGWHGTKVSSLIVALHNNGGIAGISPKSYLQHLRASGACGGYDSDVIAAIRYGAGIEVPGVPGNPTPVAIENVSLGSSGACGVMYGAAIQEALGMGVTVVAASGNNGSEEDLLRPANCPGVIAVTSHDEKGDRAYAILDNTGAPIYFPNIGIGTTLSAPGVRMSVATNTGLTTQVSDGLITANPPNSGGVSGTSFSAPMVTATLGRMKQVQPLLTPRELRSYLMNASKAFPVTSIECYQKYICGSGLLNMKGAVDMAEAALKPVVEIKLSYDPREVARNSQVYLTAYAQSGRSSTGSGAITQVSWTQLSGPVVTLNVSTVNEGVGPGAAGHPIKKSTANFYSPVTSVDKRLVFKVEVNTVGEGSSQEVVVLDLAAASSTPNLGTGVDAGGGASMVTTAASKSGGGAFSLWDLALISVFGVTAFLLRTRQWQRSRP